MTSSITMANFPLNVLENIQSFLDSAGDRRVARLVSRDWYRASNSRRIRSKDLVIIQANEEAICPTISEMIESLMQTFPDTLPTIYNLQLRNCTLSTQVVDVDQVTHVQSLGAQQTKMWAQFGANINELFIRNCNLTTSETLVDILAQCTSLVTLKVEHHDDDFSIPLNIIDRYAKLSRSFAALSSLSLDLDSDDAFHMFLSFGAAGLYPSLRTLHIDSSAEEVSTMGADLVACVQLCKNTLRELDLHNIENRVLINVLRTPGLTLTSLAVELNNEDGVYELGELIVALQLHSSTMQHLALCDTDYISLFDSLHFVQLFGVLAQMKELLSLTLESSFHDDDLAMAVSGVKIALNLPHLHTLNVLRLNSATDERRSVKVKQIPELDDSAVRHLSVTRMNISGNYLSNIAMQLVNLTVLEVASNPSLDDKFVRAVCIHLFKLHRLTVKTAPMITDYGFTGDLGNDTDGDDESYRDPERNTDQRKSVSIMRLRNLRHLVLHHIRITGQTFDCISFPLLNKLSFNGINKLNDAGLVSLALRNPSLETIEILNSERITEYGLISFLSLCPRLRHLTANCPALSVHFLQAIARPVCPTLRTVCISPKPDRLTWKERSSELKHNVLIKFQ